MGLKDNLETLDFGNVDFDVVLDRRLIDLLSIRRMILGKDLREVMSSDGNFRIPIFIPPGVVERCNSIIREALKDREIKETVPCLTPAFSEDVMERIRRDPSTDGCTVYLWQIDAMHAWQLVDRRIDE